MNYTDYNLPFENLFTVCVTKGINSVAESISARGEKQRSLIA